MEKYDEKVDTETADGERWRRGGQSYYNFFRIIKKPFKSFI